MDSFLQKISSYNLFNYLFPGALFAVFASKFTSYHLIQDNIIIGLVSYYFMGLLIGRIGSLVFEPIFRKLNFIKFVEYSAFIKASKNDSKIDLFSEINNMYRTLFSMSILLLCLKLYSYIEFKFPTIHGIRVFIFLIVLAVIFLFSHRKQTNYINKRIGENILIK